MYFNPANSTPADEWFRIEDDVNDHFECTGSAGPNVTPFWDDEDILCQHYQDILSEFGTGSDEHVKLLFTLERYYADQSGLQPLDCVVQTSIQSCIQSQIDIERDVMNLFDVDISSLLNETTTLHDILYGDGDVGELPSVIFNINQWNDQFILDEQNAVSELSQYEADLQALNCSSHAILELNRDILLDFVSFLQTDTPEDFDFANAINYSEHCSDDFGAAVHLARYMASFASDEYFDLYDDCGNDSNESRLAAESGLGTLVYPNPGAGMLNVQFDDVLTGFVKVFNTHGHCLGTYDVKDKSMLQLNVGQTEGLHFIEINNENGEQEVIKIMVINSKG